MAEKRPLFMFIMGFSCSLSRKTPEMLQKRLIGQAPSGVEVHVVCDRAEGLKLANIAARACRALPPVKTPFEVRMTEIVRKEITQRKVILAGHSHGGLQATSIAMSLADEPMIRNLHVATFGSIWTPRVLGVDIMHYMLQDDSALQCNHVARSERLGFDGSVYWLPSGKPPTFRYTILDMTRWIIHMSYRDLVAELLQAMPDVVSRWKPQARVMAPRMVVVNGLRVNERIRTSMSDVRVRMDYTLDYHLSAERTSVKPSEAVSFPYLGSPFAHAFLNAAANFSTIGAYVSTACMVPEVRDVLATGVAAPVYLSTQYSGSCGGVNASLNVMQRMYGVPMTMACSQVETMRGGAQHRAVSALMNVGDSAIVHDGDTMTMSMLKKGDDELHALIVTHDGPPDVHRYSGSDRVGLVAVYRGSICASSLCYFRDEHDEDHVITVSGKVMPASRWVAESGANTKFATTSLMFGSYKAFAYDAEGLVSDKIADMLAERTQDSDATEEAEVLRRLATDHVA